MTCRKRSGPASWQWSQAGPAGPRLVRWGSLSELGRQESGQDVAVGVTARAGGLGAADHAAEIDDLGTRLHDDAVAAGAHHRDADERDDVVVVVAALADARGIAAVRSR